MKTIRKFTVCFLVLTLLLTPCSYASAVETPAAEEPVVRVGEVESLRETNSETYLMSDGTYECVVYAENKYYLDENEVLQPINNAIVAAGGGANLLSTQYTNTANAFDVTFSGSGTPEISITYGEAGITFIPVNATGSGNMHMTASASAIAIGGVENCSTLSQLTATGSNTATYANAFGTADLVYVLENDALKEYIILEDSAAPNSYNFLFTLDGVTLQETDTGAAFLNADGEAVFYLGDLFAMDANGVPTDALTYTFQQVKDTIIGVTVTLDAAYLTAADRAFPVVIDPTIMISSSSTADACVCSYTPSTNYQMATQLRTGFCTDYGIRRSYIRFDIPDSVEPGSVINAYMDIEKMSGVAPTVRAYRVTGSWSSGSITWNNKPGYTTSLQSTQSAQLSSGSSWYRMNVTSIVNAWVNGQYINYGFALVDSVENNSSHWTTIYSSDANSPHKPELYINYDGEDVVNPPNLPSSISLNYSTLSIEKGSTQLISATVYPTSASVSWSSSNTSVATVSSSGRVTARYPGKTIITASISGASAQCEVTVIPQGGYKYNVLVDNYYDQAFTVRYPQWGTVIGSACDTAASRLASIFSLRVRSYTYSHTSKADDCKIEEFGAVASDNIDWQDCSHFPKCNTTAALLIKFTNVGSGGTNYEPSVLWTGHSMQNPGEDRSVSVDFLHDVVVTPYSTNTDFTFLHELSHQLGAPDHYCYGKLASLVCVNLNCDECYHGMAEPRSCMMSEVINIDEYSDTTLYCSDCLDDIREHLSDHH